MRQIFTADRTQVSKRFDEFVTFCNDRQKSSATERSLRWHWKKVHNNSSKYNPLKYKEIGFSKMVGMRWHSDTFHETISPTEYVYCKTFLLAKQIFVNIILFNIDCLNSQLRATMAVSHFNRLSVETWKFSAISWRRWNLFVEILKQQNGRTSINCRHSNN